MLGTGVLAAALTTAATPAGAAQFDVTAELRNYAITLQRQAVYNTPSYQAKLLQVGYQNGMQALAAQAADPSRLFVTDLCWSGFSGCAGDVRLYDWATKGYGIVRPVLFTARNGARLSGHVWATVAGPAKRPGIVITNGSVQADEQMYWFAAQTLAKAGYVVLTFDPQGQGQSDTLGTGPDALEGVPAQTDGRPFYDGTEDALDFLLSTPSAPYTPVTSCSTGTSHAAEQRSLAARGINAAYNPFFSLLDPSRIGLAGHSYGALGVSYVAQKDPRVDAVVAWDNLGSPVASGSSMRTTLGGPVSASLGAAPCPADPSRRAPAARTKPALGISADYFLPPVPNLSQPDPLLKSDESRRYSADGVDTGEIVIRGGSHLDFSFIPLTGLGASLRGADLTAWYTTAWFDKYVKRDPAADERLLTTRWRDDAANAKVDPTRDGNVFSSYYRSRLDVTRAAGRFVCEDLRTGCDGQAPDGGPASYSYLATATTPDARTGPGAGLPGRNSIYPRVLTEVQTARYLLQLPLKLGPALASRLRDLLQTARLVR